MFVFITSFSLAFSGENTRARISLLFRALGAGLADLFGAIWPVLEYTILLNKASRYE